MADYADFLELAINMISEHGCEMTYVRRKESGRINAATGKREAAETRTDFTGLITRPHKEDVQSGIFQKSTMVILASGDLTDNPDITDVILCNGHEYAILEISTVAPDGMPIIYKFGVSGRGRQTNA